MNNSDSLQADRNGYTGSPGMTRPNGNIPQLDTSYDSQQEKHMFENEMNIINAANMRGNTYYNSKTEEITFNGTPRKDPQQFIDFPHDDHKGDIGPESGYSTAETSKPKKIKPKHRHLDNFYYDDFVPFAHDPPGHTCGLPCCNSDLHIHLKVGRSHGGCMSVPIQHDIPADNFTLQRGHMGLFKGQSQLQNRSGIKSGFYSVQPVRGNVPPPRTLPKFGSVRGNTLPSALSGTTPLCEQMHFLRGREITLPKIARQNPAAFNRSAPFILADASVGETVDTDSDVSSDSDLDYYMLSDFKSHVQVTNTDNRHTDGKIEDNPVTQELIYPWKMLEETQKQRYKSGSLSESSTYYDVIEDLKNDLKNYSWPRENQPWSRDDQPWPRENQPWSRDDQRKIDVRFNEQDKTPNPQHEIQSIPDIKCKEEEKIQSPKYGTFNFESNLFTPDRRHTLDTSMRYNPPIYDERKQRTQDTKKHKRRRRPKQTKPKSKPTLAYAQELSDSYKSRSLPLVFPTVENCDVEQARSRLRKVHVIENNARTPVPQQIKVNNPFAITASLSQSARVEPSHATQDSISYDTRKPVPIPKNTKVPESGAPVSHETRTPILVAKETQEPVILHHHKDVRTPTQQQITDEPERPNLKKSRSQFDINTRNRFNENDHLTELRHTDFSDVDKSRSLPPNTAFGYENKGFIIETDDKSTDTLRRLVGGFKSQSLPPVLRPISFEAARVGKNRVNSSESYNDDLYTQRLPTVEENPITLIL